MMEQLEAAAVMRKYTRHEVAFLLRKTQKQNEEENCDIREHLWEMNERISEVISKGINEVISESINEVISESINEVGGDVCVSIISNYFFPTSNNRLYYLQLFIYIVFIIPPMITHIIVYW